MNRATEEDIAVTPREASALLTTREGLPDPGLDPISKPLLGALFEQAFPTSAPRGLAYAEERADIENWLLGCATAHMEDSDRRLLATAGAWIASHDWGDENEEGSRSLILVRAIATYFIQYQADTLADTLTDAKKFEAQGGTTP